MKCLICKNAEAVFHFRTINKRGSIYGGDFCEECKDSISRLDTPGMAAVNLKGVRPGQSLAEVMSSFYGNPDDEDLADVKGEPGSPPPPGYGGKKSPKIDPSSDPKAIRRRIFSLKKKMDIAIKEERYEDAAILRDEIEAATEPLEEEE
jgi:protein-arginine kinase activator protein McsA